MGGGVGHCSLAGGKGANLIRATANSVRSLIGLDSLCVDLLVRTDHPTTKSLSLLGLVGLLQSVGFLFIPYQEAADGAELARLMRFLRLTPR